MTIIVGIYRGAIVVTEAPTSVSPQVQQAMLAGIEGGAQWASKGMDYKDYWDCVKAGYSSVFSGTSGLEVAKIVGANAFGTAVTIAVVKSGAGAAVIGAAAWSAGVLVSPALVATAAVVASVAAGYYAADYYSYVFSRLLARRDVLSEALYDLNKNINDVFRFVERSMIAAYYDDAQRFAPRADPLVLDLDGDGLETVGLNLASPVYFDHNADGIKTGTGWVKSDDAFLVLDRNGNGIIDDGRELFGDATPLNGKGTLDPSAGIAAQGFAALAKEDTNLDGVVNAADARFGALRLWRDCHLSA